MEEVTSEIKDFLKECNDMFSSSETNLNPKIVGNYVLNRHDVSAQVIDWVFHYLETKKCPYNLAVAIANETAQQINDGISEQQLKENSLDQGKVLNSLILYNETISKLTSVCKSLVEKAEETKLDSFAPLFTASVFAIKNKRRKMEDRHVIHHDLNMLLSLKDSPIHSYYAVFDGHSGVDAASYASAHLHINIANHPAFLTDTVTAIAEGYKITDDNFYKKSQEENLKSGTTAVCALFRESTVFLSWLGDSQAVLVKEGKPLLVTSPHKPDRDDERKRVEDLGGCISFGGTLRVNGMLAVTRALGDADHKPFISSEPEITAINLDGTEDFLILACDGLWDGMSPDDVIAALYYNLLESDLNEPLETVAAKLVHQSKLQGSEDNITAVVIFLRDIKAIKQDAEKYIPNLSKANLATNFLGINGEDKSYSNLIDSPVSKPTVLEFNNSSTTKLKNTSDVLSAAGLGESSFAYSFSENAENLAYYTKIEQNISSSVAPETTALSELPTPPIDDVLASLQFEKEFDSSVPNTVVPSSDSVVCHSDQNITLMENISPDEAMDIASSVVSNAIETAVKCLSEKESDESISHVSTQKLNPYAAPFVMKSFSPDSHVLDKSVTEVRQLSPEVAPVVNIETDQNTVQPKENEFINLNPENSFPIKYQVKLPELSATGVWQLSSEVSPVVNNETDQSTVQPKENEIINLNPENTVPFKYLDENSPLESISSLELTPKIDLLLADKEPLLFNETQECLLSFSMNESKNEESFESKFDAAFAGGKLDTNLNEDKTTVEPALVSNMSHEMLNLEDNLASLNLSETQKEDKDIENTAKVVENEMTQNLYNLLDSENSFLCNSNLKIDNCIEFNISDIEKSSMSVETAALPKTSSDEMLVNLNISKQENTEKWNNNDICNVSDIKAQIPEGVDLFENSEHLLEDVQLSSNLNIDSVVEGSSIIEKSDSLIVQTSIVSETSLLSNKNETVTDILADKTDQNLDESSKSIGVTEIKSDVAVFSETANILVPDPSIILEGISLPLTDMKENISTAAVLPSDETHIESVAVDLQTVPVGVPEAEGVTEDVDSDSEKDGGWSYMKGNTVGGVKQKATTVGKTTDKLRKEISKPSSDGKSKIRNISSIDKNKKCLPEKKTLDARDKSKGIKSLPPSKIAANKTSKVISTSEVKKETSSIKVSTIASNRITRAPTAPRNPVQSKCSNLPNTIRSQTTNKPVLTSNINIKPKSTIGVKTLPGILTSTPLPKKPAPTQSTKSNSTTTRSTISRPTSSTVPSKSLLSARPSEKPTPIEAKARSTSATVKRTIPSTLRKPIVKETKDLANKEISEKRNALPKTSKVLPPSISNTLRSTLPASKKPITNSRSAPLRNEAGKKDVPKAQFSRLTAKSSTQPRLPRDTAKAQGKNTLPLQKKFPQNNSLKGEVSGKNAVEATASEEEKFIREVNDKEIPAKELIDIATDVNQEAPMENGCIIENNCNSVEDEIITKPAENLL